MNHYFRLLFVSFVLLLLMGLNERQSADCCSSLRASESLLQQAVHTGILPEEGWLSSELIVPAVNCLQAFQFPENGGQRESPNSLSVRTMLICCTGEFMEYRPGIAWKTGQYLHFQTSKGDPPQS